MPLPTIDLDTRRYPDLVDEARSLIPRYAPEWTNENASDPGVTLLELLAFLTEQLVYRANRIPARHRRKFIELVGFAPSPPLAARTALSIRPGTGGDGLVLPAGLAFAAAGVPFRTVAPLTLTETSLVTLQVFDGTLVEDLTASLRQGLPVAAFGSDPEPGPSSTVDEQPALYLGFDAPVPAGRELALHMTIAGPRTGADERARIDAETALAAAGCTPLPGRDCGAVADEEPDATAATSRLRAIRTEWDVYDGTAWRTLDAGLGEVDDTTMAFTLDGAVALRAPVALVPAALGETTDLRAYVRCRLASGVPDDAPVLLHVAANAVDAEQRTPVRQTFAIAAGTAAPAIAPAPGATTPLALSLDSTGAVVSLAAPGASPPEALVLDYQPATAAAPGSLTATLAQVGRGSGGPEQTLVLPAAPVADGDVAIWTLEPAGATSWLQVPDFDAAGDDDAVFTLDPELGVVSFGDGLYGRVPPEGAPILARYDATRASAGNVAAGAAWVLAGADDELNTALLARDPAAVQALIATVSSADAAAGGAEAELLSHTAGRAAARLWSHERLVDCCTDAGAATLDQIDRAEVLGLAAPPRAATLLDLERLALDVPGTRVARARAFGGLDGRYPGLVAPGTVTVVLVAGLPRQQPQPSRDLLDTVSAFLRRRKTLGTRLVVVGPTYVEVSVTATLTVLAGADQARVEADGRAALAAYLDPLTGGPARRGWPFGRDVYRSEMLQLLDGVGGVDHVAALELVGPDGASCGNVCIPPTSLPVSGTHTISVVA